MIAKLPHAPLLINEEFLDAAIELVSESLRYIYISTFKAEIIDKQRGKKLASLFYLLFKKAESGVNVRLLINNISNRGTTPISNFNAINACKNGGVKVRTLPNGRVCHAKVLIADNYLGIVGSHNLSVKSCRANFEVSYMITGTHTVTVLRQVYDEIWERAKEA